MVNQHRLRKIPILPIKFRTDGIREKFMIIASVINDGNIPWTASVLGSRLFLTKKSGNVLSTPSITSEFAPPAPPPSTPNLESFFKKNTGLYMMKEGEDGLAPDVSSYLGNQNDHTGFYALDDVDLFNIMVIPRDFDLTEDNHKSLWGPASAYCKKRRAFLIIEPPPSWSNWRKVLDPNIGIKSLRVGVAKDHAAIYFPNLTIRKNGIITHVGPGGAIAGLYSRIDSSGGGVWKAPAGLSADIQGNISGLQAILTDSENGALNKEGINCLRGFPVWRS